METVSRLRQQAFVIKVRWFFLIGFVVLIPVASWRWHQAPLASSIFEPPIQPIQSEPLCPWREPQEDLKVLFPQATRYQVETLILSGLRTGLTKELGRAPTGDENALHAFRVYSEREPVGTILTRRVKGTYGAIELVLGVDLDGQVRGLRIQRQREPEGIAKAIEQPDWLRSFAGKRASSSWRLGTDLPDVEADARDSAEAIVQGTRSLLILLAAANQAHISTVAHH